MIKICIVEDEEPIANLIRMSLTKYGYSCTCVYDGLEAANLLEQERFDLLLLDIMMPGGGYCFAPTHLIQDNSPLENVLEMYRCAREFGRC